MKLGLGVKIGTSLSLTPQLQQAIRLLQLSGIELEQEVQLKLESNPLLERQEGDTDPASMEDVSHPTADPERRLESDTAFDLPDKPTLGEQMSQTQVGEELVVDTKWDDIYIHTSTKWDQAATTEYEYQGETTDSIQSHLAWQMNLAHLSPVDQLICQRLIDSVDERGYMVACLDEMRDNLNAELVFSGIDYDIEPIEITTVLKKLQQCEPLGVAARDLPECLQLQLSALAEQVAPDDCQAIEDARAILEHHVLLTKNDIKNLLRQTALDMERLTAAMATIRLLDPYPASTFLPQESSYQIPDVLVSVQRDADEQVAFQVRLNPDTLPKLRVNNQYAKLIKRADDSKDNVYLKTQLQDAKHFIKGVDERNKSLLKVASAIVAQQQRFFEYGATEMKPLILRDIAEQVELHESTVSRITTNKYMLTPLGLFELKYFFSSHVGTDADAHSSTAICSMIKQMVALEDAKKPLSDSKIVKLLQEKNIEVARRTVAKYRETMGIGSSTERKRLL